MRTLLFTSSFTLFLASFATAQLKTFEVALTGSQEVPPVRSAGTATAIVTLNTNTGAVSVTGRYSNLTSAAMACHIHGAAPRGMNAGVVLGLTQTGGTSGMITGGGTLMGPQVQAILDGLTYINLHTMTNLGGELRGQIDIVPGSGSPRSGDPAISGGASPGSTLMVACPPSTLPSFLLVGIALPACRTRNLPGTLACASPTGLALDLALPPVVLTGARISISIPAGTPSFHAGLQCIELDRAQSCVRLSMAHRVAIQ